MAVLDLANLYLSGDEQRYHPYRLFTIGTWTKEEHRLFLNGIARYGNDWKEVVKLVGITGWIDSADSNEDHLPDPHTCAKVLLKDWKRRKLFGVGSTAEEESRTLWFFSCIVGGVWLEWRLARKRSRLPCGSDRPLTMSVSMVTTRTIQNLLSPLTNIPDRKHASRRFPPLPTRSVHFILRCRICILTGRGSLRTLAGRDIPPLQRVSKSLCIPRHNPFLPIQKGYPFLHPQ